MLAYPASACSCKGEPPKALAFLSFLQQNLLLIGKDYMDFKDILRQVERPYWSPMHPKLYIKRGNATSGVSMLFGWGLCYPEDIGAFNLMWLVSGVGGPPDNYGRYAAQSKMVIALGSHYLTPQHTVNSAAALLPIGRFDKLITWIANPLHEPLRVALRLKV